MIVGRRVLLALLASAICLGPLAAQNSTLPDAAPAPGGRIAAVTAQHGMVVAQEARAARIGVDILRQGGNAVDAAVATGFALAVTYPRAGNIGGGGYMLVHLAGRNLDTAIDYRETAPAATTPEIFLDQRGEADPQKSRDSALAIGVPGTVAGLSLAHTKYGSGRFTLGAVDRAGDPARARGHSDRGRYRGLAAALAGAPGALAVHGEDLLRRRPRARSRRDPGTEGPRRYACRDRPVGAGSVLRGCDRREDRQPPCAPRAA